MASGKSGGRKLGYRGAGCEEGGSGQGGQAEGSVGHVKLIESVGICVCVYVTCMLDECHVERNENVL